MKPTILFFAKSSETRFGLGEAKASMSGDGQIHLELAPRRCPNLENCRKLMNVKGFPTLSSRHQPRFSPQLSCLGSRKSSGSGCRLFCRTVAAMEAFLLVGVAAEEWVPQLWLHSVLEHTFCQTLSLTVRTLQLRCHQSSSIISDCAKWLNCSRWWSPRNQILANRWCEEGNLP